MENSENSNSSNSNDSEVSDVEQPDNACAANTRSKRDLAWRPISASTSRYYSNPIYSSKMQLFSRTGYHLAVYPDGEVRGTQDDNDLHTYLELTSGGQSSHVRIKGLLCETYVAMDNKGRLYAEPNPNEESTIFIETFQAHYSTYLSKNHAHKGWYIGIKRNGKFKRGPKTKFGQKAICFLPRRRRFQ